MKKLLCLTMVITLTLSSAAFAFAQNDKGAKSDKPEKNTVVQNQDNGNSKKADANKTDTLKEKALESEKEAKEKIKANLAEKKRLIKEQYTTKELTNLEEASKKIKNSDQTLKVLDVTSIVSNKKFKFDTPPVIKGGRTLIPVRAITEGLGAAVKWNAETKQVTITKDQTTIVLTLGSTTALVNGVEVKLDTNADTMNNRTYVPLRFIMETFKMQVNYEEGTIEITNPATTTPDTTSTGAISTTTGGISTTTEGALTSSQGAIDLNK